MPLTHYECPDGIKIETTECLKEGGCRLNERCATRSYLRLVSSDRKQKYICPKCKKEVGDDGSKKSDL